MKRSFILAAVAILHGTIASAGITADQVIDAFKAEGYTSIEVHEGSSQITVEAVKDGQKVEVVYDVATGDVIKTEGSGSDGARGSGSHDHEDDSDDDGSDDDDDDNGSDDDGSSGGDDDGSDD